MRPWPDEPRRRPASLAELGSLIGDPVRAAILVQLSDGSHRPAGELAALAGVSPQAVSAHLARLVDGGLLAVEPQGRHRFYRIGSGEMAEMLEDLASWVDEPKRRQRHDPNLCAARLCYDHLAGRVGVAVFDRLVERRLLLLGSDGPRLSDAGAAWCDRIGVDLQPRPGSRRAMARVCLDWTERRPHLGGHLGAALADRLIGGHLLDPGPTRRSLLVTAKGVLFLKAELDLRLT